MFEHEPMLYEGQAVKVASWAKWVENQEFRDALTIVLQALQLPVTAKGWIQRCIKRQVSCDFVLANNPNALPLTIQWGELHKIVVGFPKVTTVRYE